nr:hypothetical protein [Lachnospiraceae bacterium]
MRQRKRSESGLLAVLLMLAMVLGQMSGMRMTAFAADDGIHYFVGSYNEKVGCILKETISADYIPVETSTTSWEDGKLYVVNEDVAISDRITVSGTVHLILCDGKTLTAEKGIDVTEGNTLNIYGEINSTGTLTATGYKTEKYNAYTYAAAIGGNDFHGSSRKINNCGTVNIHGGKVIANGSGENCAGIGGPYDANGGYFNMYYGEVTATGGNFAPGIGGGFGGDGTGVIATIYGGTITATGSDVYGKYSPGDGIGMGSATPTQPSNHGTLTVVSGVSVEGSSDNSSWETMETPLAENDSRYQYMKVSSPEPKVMTLDDIYYFVGSYNETDGCILKETLTKDYNTVDISTTSWEDGEIYVVKEDVTISDRITVSGTAHLILCDGKTLTAVKGIEVTEGNTLNIYGESKSTGTLTASGYYDYDKNEKAPAIGGSSNNCGTVNIHGGVVNANGSGQDCAGIGGANTADGGYFNMYSGEVTATGGSYSAGIGGGTGGSGKGVIATVYGGTIIATGGSVDIDSYGPADGIGTGSFYS